MGVSGDCPDAAFAYEKVGYEFYKELGPAEIVEITAEDCKVLAAPGKEMKICSFLWSYYGFPNSTYEGVNVEVMRYRNGRIMAPNEKEKNDIKTCFGFIFRNLIRNIL